MLTATLLLAIVVQADKPWGPRDYENKVLAEYKAVERLREGKDYIYFDEKKRPKAVFSAWEAICPVCDNKFKVGRTGDLREGPHELDGKVSVYVLGNRYLFQFWMCPKCNYCADWSVFENRVDAKVIKAAIPAPKEYASYFEIQYSDIVKRAEQCLVACKTEAYAMAQFYLYGAWVAKDSGEKEAAKEYYAKAREQFVAVVETEIGTPKQKAFAAFFAGESSRQIGEPDVAVKHLDNSLKLAQAENMSDLIDRVVRCREQIKKDREPKK